MNQNSPSEKDNTPQRAVLKNEKWLEIILESAPIGIFAKNLSQDGKLIIWNKMMETIFQLPKERVIGKRLEDVLVDERDHTVFIRADHLVSKTGKSMDIPFMRLHSVRHETLLKMTYVPVKDPDTDELVVVCTVEDVTQSKASEKNLIRQHQEREDLEKIVNLSPVILFLFRKAPSFPVEFASANVWRMGVRDGFFAVEESGLTTIIGEENESLFREQIERINVQTPEVRFDFFSRIQNRWFEVTLRPVDRMSQGQSLIQGVFNDITEKRRFQEETAKAKRQAEAANEAKSRFLATVSHELRTPLNGILGMTTLTLDTALNDEQREFLDLVKDSAEGLLQLINDILDFSKIEAGQLYFEWIPVQVGDLVRRVYKSMKTLGEKKKISLHLDLHEDLEQEFLLDPVRLSQILNNLIGNSLKFTESGFIKIRACPLDLVDPAILRKRQVEFKGSTTFPIYFSIEDSGIGIAPDKQDLIFNEFSQSDVSTSRKYGGTGLGLAICRTLVHRFGGEIWVESDLGQGSTFHFFIGGKMVQGAVESRQKNESETNYPYRFPNTPLKILLAEDNPVNCRVAVKNLEKLGWSVVTVVNGLEAVKRNEKEEFDAILMDIHMPVMDGFQALQHIRNQKELGNAADIPVLAMTAAVSKNEVSHLYEVGFDGHISKPFKLNDLKKAVWHAVMDRGGK